MTSSTWYEWPPEKWLSNPAKPPECHDWSDAEWERRVEFMGRVIRGQGTAEARAANRGTRAPSAMSKADDVPLHIRAEIVAAAKRRDRALQAKNADLRRRLLAEADAQDAERAEAKRQADADRALQARGGLPRIVPTPTPELHASSVKVGDEPLIYGPGSSWSWIRDMFAARTANMGAAIPSREVGMGISEVAERLHRNDRQMAHLARTTDRARGLYRNYFSEKARAYHQTVSDHGLENFRNFVFAEFERSATAVELRTVTTSSSEFAPPIFWLEQWQKFRTAAAPAAARAANRELPPTGMQVTIPAFSAGVTMSVQTTQGAAVATSTPTAAFREAPVLTIAGSVKLSQQFLDRAGPGVGADEVIAEQAAREAATTLDSQVLSAIIGGLATSHKIANSGTAGVPALWADVAKASSLTTTAEGTRLPLDTVLMPPANGAWFRAQVDKQTRPIWLPSGAGVAARVGAPDSALEGYTGYDLQGTLVFEDANLAPTSTHATLIAGNFGRGILVMTGTPIVDVWPEFDPATLTAIITVRQYVATALLYSSAFVRISGSAYAKTPTFSGS